VKEIVIVSGKGGTGKTSFVASFAELNGRPVALGDCDVDAANLALLLPGQDNVAEPFHAGYKASIEPELCTGCLVCMETCRFAAIRLSERGMPHVDELSCEGCRACSVVCPAEAIEFIPNQAGTVFQRKTRCGPLVHAELGVAQGNSGKLVARVREKIRSIGEELGLQLALIDGPPGIGCPVHASLGGADLVVAVTEPTPSGLHDLVRMIDLLQHFKLHSVLLVNKWDLNPQMTEAIERTARKRGVRPIGRVPFDGRVAMALAQGRTPLVVPPAQRALKMAWQEIGYTLAATAVGGSDAA